MTYFLVVRAPMHDNWTVDVEGLVPPEETGRPGQRRKRKRHYLDFREE